MKAIYTGALLFAALAGAAAACQRTTLVGGEPAANAQAQDTPGQSKDPFAAIPRVTVEELAKALKEGRAVAVDVRPPEAFELEHIPGAVSIPEEEVNARAGELPKDKLVVTYCA